MDQLSESDPWTVLGLTVGASTEEIRARYLELVKQYPPERCAEEFSAIRAAYDQVRDPLRLWQRRLFLASDHELGELLDARPVRCPRIPTDLLLRAVGG